MVLFIVAFWFITPKDGALGWSLWVLGLYAIALHALLIPLASA
jgi:hypothetical protein